MDNHERRARRAKLLLAGLTVLVVGALAVGGVVAHGLIEDGNTRTPAAGPTAGETKPSAPAPAGSRPAMTPERAKKVSLNEPTGQRGGASTGFPHSPGGAISAVVHFWEEYAWMDDEKARQQLDVVTSPDATGYVDRQISEVRKLREGAGLPVSGGTPAGITFTTTVDAVRMRSLTDDDLPRGDVVHIWLSFDRYATTPDRATDDNPVKGDTTDFIVKWQDGAWRITDEPAYVAQRTFPVAYDPDSPIAWRDQWIQVRHED
ncbi:hypothetical protein OM788_006514 [Streptomyces sp. KA12]|uniref:hypothetical protein n=1 Tax=Streptomyces sp. KA12 TaxID=2991730 RepID=UPI0023AEF1C2|nr:hypothetical protein [Streptomyces sp. KA12]MDF0376521.1 hypothetical protein [Streptomyces sp. KA12]